MIVIRHGIPASHFSQCTATVYVVDALMGQGKTSAMINYMNNAPKDTLFLYITPYLTEVERIIRSCPVRRFRQPEAFGSKISGIKYLFEKKENIVSTHKLFSLFDDEIISLAKENGYVLVMDEVMSVVEPLPISKHDLATIMEKYAAAAPDGRLKWHAQDYRGEFDTYKQLCNAGCIGVCKNSAILWLFPIKIFLAFREIYILTYLFNAQTQRYYYEYYGIQFTRKYCRHIRGAYELCDKPTDVCYPDFERLIQISENKRINDIGRMETALSKSWYDRNSQKRLMTQLKNNTINYFKNIVKTRSSLNLWTTFKDYKDEVSGKGYTKGFLSSNMRATNEYRNRTSVAFLVNKYYNPYVRNFFISNGITVDEDMFALSEMLQFIWRSAIREGRETQLYVPSIRMRRLLQQWIADMKKGGC